MVNDKVADQTARMCRLACAFAVHNQEKSGFSCLCPYDVEAQASWPPPGYAPASQKKTFIYIGDSSH